MFKKKLKKIIKIEGMHCDHCALKVKESLESLKEIDKVKVNLAKKEALLTLNESILDSKIKDEIKELGFEVVSIDN